MPAAANESQGLKIAVAAFVSLTVILAVTCYFLYSAYDKADAQLRAEQAKVSEKSKAASDALNQYDEMRKQIGPRAEDFEAVKAEIKAEQKKVDDELSGLVQSYGKQIGDIQAAGATGPELQTAKEQLQTISSAYLSEPNKNYISSMNRLKDVIKQVASIDSEVARNYVTLKRSLESANGTNQQKLDVETQALAKAKEDLEAEHKKHVEERELLVQKLDQLQTENGKQAAELASLGTRLRELTEDSTKKLALSNQIIREQRDRLESSEDVLDRPDGYVTFTDYGRGEVRTNLSRNTGARPQMKFTIFDRRSAGVPTERPKGTIELVHVGETYSIARIVNTKNPIEPIRTGDIVYSPAWSPNDPMRFALIGKIDVNRDGKDDRNDLKRMIEAAGGVVDYDLPPPDIGRETGKLSARDAWYVTDDRMPFNLDAIKQIQKGVTSSETSNYLRQKSEAIREARVNGVRPLSIERLLAYLGYEYGAQILGRAEAVNRGQLNMMLRSRTTPQPKPAAAPAEDSATPKEEATKEEAPKEEMPKEEK